MNHKMITITCTDEQKQILIALLSDIDYEGFEDLDDKLLAYLPENKFDEGALMDIINNLGLQVAIASIAPKNWNEEWESNFQPVIIKDIATIRADFHDLKIETPHEIIITPKMSFGTGHHATTQLMIQAMNEIDFSGKKVLDFGTGTGVLALFASQLGASQIIAIDTEDWSCENTIENAERNAIGNISVQVGSLERVADENFDIILANINRHILLSYMEQVYSKLNDKGLLLLSGILEEDIPLLSEAAKNSGFSFLQSEVNNNWAMMKFIK